MKGNVARIASIVLLVLLQSALGQVSTGTPPFGSFGGGPFDIVNLGNLNTHFDIPVIQKAGRGAPYTFALSYDNTVWTPVTSSGTATWTAAPNYGWNFTVPQYAFGYVTAATITSYTQPCNPPSNMNPVNVSIFGKFVFFDAKGTPHAFPQTFLISYQSITGCPAVNAPPTSGTSLAIDASGYTINAWGANGGASASIVGSDGKIVNLQQTSSTTTDANGNEVTSATDTHGNMVITDTLGQTALTISGTNPVALSYAAPSGTSAEYKINYSPFNIKTNFNCSSVVDPTINGAMLITEIDLPDGTSYKFAYETNGSYYTGRLATVTLPTQGTISYTYPGANDGANCTDGSALGLTRTLSSPGGEWTYSRAQVSGQWQTTVTSPLDTANSPSASDVTLVNFAQDTNGTYNFYETQRQVYQGAASGTPLETITTCYNTNYSNCASAAVSAPITQTDTYTQLGTSSNRLSEVKFNSYGLPTDDMEYNYGVALSVSPAPSLRVRETATTYATLGNGIVYRPATVIVSDWSSGSQATLASTTYGYDQTTPTTLSGTPQHTSITGSRGNLTSVASQANSTTTLYQVISYYDTGMAKTATDLGTTTAGGSNVTTYNYPDATSTCGNAFPTSVSEPLSLSQSYTWNCIGGVMTTAVDENTKTATYDYTTDPSFWRPDFALDQLQYKTTYSYSTLPTATETYLKFNGTGVSVWDLRTTLDTFGRLTLNQKAQSPAFAEYDSTETDFDIMNRPYRSTMPFQAVAGGTNSTVPSTTTTFDALGRPTKIVDGSGGTTQYQYINNDVLQTISGSPTFQKQLEYDGLGRLAWVCEISSTLPGVGTCGQSTKTGYWTQYTYDALGNLLSVAQNTQVNGTPQTRTYTYDMLSRLTSEKNPETGKNGVSGTVSYTYDVACSPRAASPGDLTKRVDNAGNTTCYGYDGLHRLTDAGNNGPTCRHFRYDSQTPPSGVTVTLTLARMAEAFTDACSGSKLTDEWFGYDADGNLTDFYESTPNSGGYYHSVATYWANGAINGLSAKNSSASLIFPTIYYGTSTGAGLDGEGRYTKVYGSSGTNPVTGVTYTNSGTAEPIGSLTKTTYGSSDNDNFTYDTGTGRLKTYTFAINGVNDKGTLTWNTNGTLGKLIIADSLSGTSDSQTCNYYYDDLGRLGGNTSGHSVDCGSTKWQQLFTFDAFGNITKSGSGSFAPIYPFSNGAITNQFFSIPQASVSYDSNGNLLTDNLNTYTWDPNWGNPASVNSTNLIYDGLGRMVEQQNGSAHTQILYSQVGKTAIMSGQTLTKAFVYLPGGGTAIYNSSGLAYYRHADWLGSSRLTSTASRTVYSASAYAPFGEQYTQSGTADPSFTGQNSDTTGSLYDFVFRESSPTQGRWISPDPAGMSAMDPTNPQTWNRYAYVMNSPLALIDPLGTCSQLTYTTVTVTSSNGSTYTYNTMPTVQWLYDGPCNNPCGPGLGYTWAGGFIVCGPPGNLGTIQSQVLGQIGSASGGGATIQQGNKQVFKDYCSHQADLAALEALLPGVTGGNYVPTVNRISAETGAHVALEAAAGSTALKYAIRSATGVPMSITSKFLGYVTAGLLVFSGYESYKAMVNEYQTCTAYEGVNTPDPAVVQAVP